MGSTFSLPKGVVKQVVREGDSNFRVKRGENVTVHCTGAIHGGFTFWSTRDEGQEAFTFSCGVGKVIKGLDEGVLSMTKGEIACFILAPEVAYGDKGFPAWNIPANATLVFQIEMLNIDKK